MAVGQRARGVVSEPAEQEVDGAILLPHPRALKFPLWLESAGNTGSSQLLEASTAVNEGTEHATLFVRRQGWPMGLVEHVLQLSRQLLHFGIANSFDVSRVLPQKDQIGQ